MITQITEETFEQVLHRLKESSAIDLRGHGLSAVRRFVKQWNGKLSVRSGTAKLSIIPDWARGKAKETNLTYLAGAQINIMLPEV